MIERPTLSPNDIIDACLRYVSIPRIIRRNLILSWILGILLFLVNHGRSLIHRSADMGELLAGLVTIIILFFVFSYLTVLARWEIRPGEKTPAGGRYRCSTCDSFDELSVIQSQKGAKLPSCPNCKSAKWYPVWHPHIDGY